MSEDGKKKGEGEGEGKKEAKKLNVTVIHAVDSYHSRGQMITVNDDPYHQALLKSGYLRLEKAGH